MSGLGVEGVSSVMWSRGGDGEKLSPPTLLGKGPGSSWPLTPVTLLLMAVTLSGLSSPRPRDRPVWTLSLRQTMLVQESLQRNCLDFTPLVSSTRLSCLLNVRTAWGPLPEHNRGSPHFPKTIAPTSSVKGLHHTPPLFLILRQLHPSSGVTVF